MESKINCEASASFSVSPVVKDPNGTSTGTVHHEMDIDTHTPTSASISVSPVVKDPSGTSTETVHHEMEVDTHTPTSASISVSPVDKDPNGTFTETVHHEMDVDTHTPASAGVRSEVSVTQCPPMTRPNVPFSLIHIWEDHYTPNDTSNLTDPRPLETPDNVLAVPSFLLREFLSLLTERRVFRAVPEVSSTVTAEHRSSDASNTSTRPKSGSATRSVLRFVPRTRLSPILEESPEAPSKSPVLDYLIKARQDSISGSRTDTSEIEMVARAPSPGSGSAQRAIRDPMTAAATPAVLRESPSSTVQSLQNLAANTPCKTKVDLEFSRLMSESIDKENERKAAEPESDDEIPHRPSQRVRPNGPAIKKMALQSQVSRPAHELRMRLRSQETQNYDAEGNLVLSNPNAGRLLSNLIELKEPFDSDDEGLPMLPPPQRNRTPGQASPLQQPTGSTEASQAWTEDAAVSQPTTELVNHDEQAAANETSSPQSSPEIGNSQLIVTSPSATPPAETLPAETPRNRGWGLGSLFSSARSVSRFIPGFGHSTPAQFREALPVVDTSAITMISNSPQLALPAPENATTPFIPQVSRATNDSQTEPRHNAPATAGPARGAQTAPRKTFKPRREMKEQAAKAAMKSDMRTQADETAGREEMREKAEKATKPGQKRKRAPSPDSIPNPPGCSYGMDLDYFLYSSSSDEEVEENVDTPIRKGKERMIDGVEQPRSKRVKVNEERNESVAATYLEEPNLSLSAEHSPRGRTSYRFDPPSSNEVIGDPHRARPYTGTMFALPSSKGPIYHGGNVFEQADSTKKAAEHASAYKSGLDEYIPTPSRTFTVPYGSDSEDDDDDEEDQPELETSRSVANKEVGTTTPKRVGGLDEGSIALLDKFFGAPKDATPAAKPAVSSSPQAPSRPSSSNGTLPASSSAADTEALARARSQALKYTPKQPSGLRAQSRLSNSIVGSDVGDKAHEVIGGLETSAADRNSIYADEGQQGDSRHVGLQDNAIVWNGNQKEQQGRAGMTVREAGQQPSGGAMNGMDGEVRAALDAIPESDLMHFNFPRMRTYAEQGILEPEVEASMDVNWTEQDTARAEQAFPIMFNAWKAEQQFMETSIGSPV